MRSKRVFTILLLLVLTLGLVSSLSLAQGEGPQDANAPEAALGSAFTYQGSLSDGAGPVTGACVLTFRLYDAQTGGSLLGTQRLDDVQVDGGLFTVLLDFGASPFQGDARWLEIEVDCGSGPSVLSPRQALTPVPYALYAASAPGNTYQAGTGLALNSTTFSLAKSYRLPQGCKSGQLAKWDGKVWVCKGDSTGGNTDWHLTGNAGTTAGTNFLGTTDYQPLELHVESQRALRLEPALDRSTLLYGFSPNVVGGQASNEVTAGVFGATIGGGGSEYGCGLFNGDPCPNRVTAEFGTVGGGLENVAGHWFASIGGGVRNTASGFRATVGGGGLNDAGGTAATVGGGEVNTASGDYATVGGGWHTSAAAKYATIAGGGPYDEKDPANTSNRVTDDYGTVSGGAGNQAGDNTGDTESAILATVGGGVANTASGGSSTVGGGYGNTASAYSATVGGGDGNSASEPYASVGGGGGNTASGVLATVGGGADNTASAYSATVPGGAEATASHWGQWAYASGSFANPGDAQTSIYVLRRSFSGEDTQELFLDDGLESRRLTIAPGQVLTFDILAVVHAASGESAGWSAQGVIENVGGTTTLFGGPLTANYLGGDAATSTWTVTVSALDTATDDALKIEVSGGVAGQESRWVATVRTVEVVGP